MPNHFGPAAGGLAGFTFVSRLCCDSSREFRGGVSPLRWLLPLMLVTGIRPGMSEDGPAEPRWIGYFQDAVSASAFDGNFRVKLSGLADLEAYSVPATAPGLIFTDDPFLLNPRLSLFLDGQAGAHVYFFAQARVDRGFDPSDGGAEARLDEYAIRVTPWEDGRFSLQIGKFATVVGNWTPRHLSWDNPFINAPLPYENLTAIWD